MLNILVVSITVLVKHGAFTRVERADVGNFFQCGFVSFTCSLAVHVLTRTVIHAPDDVFNAPQKSGRETLVVSKEANVMTLRTAGTCNHGRTPVKSSRHLKAGLIATLS